MLGISLLNEIFMHNINLKANEILEQLRNEIKKSLKQTGNKNETKDGMDISLCIINSKTNTLQYAGANNPLYIVRDEKLETKNKKLPNQKIIVFKANRQPIGIYVKERPFINHEYQLIKTDKLYLFSDGFADQFGGERNSKYLIKNFRKLLLSIADKSMPEQKIILEKSFKEWKCEKEQVDDVLVVGIKI